MNDAKKYKVVVYQIETSNGLSWYAEFPDFGGVAGGGDTPEQAMNDAYENLAEMITYYHENKIPLPSISDTNNDYSGRVTLRMSKSLHARVAEQALKENVSLNSYICEAVSSYCTVKLGAEIFRKCIFKSNDNLNNDTFIENVGKREYLNGYSNYQSLKVKESFAS